MNSKIVLAAIALFAMVACQNDSPPLSGPPRAPISKIERAPVDRPIQGLTIDMDPRVDILFVIDNSGSMEKHQQKLSANINRFVDALAKIKAIDFHIGYTVVHDSSRYGSIVQRECGGKIHFDEPGTLQPLKGENLPADGRRYVTRDDDFTQILKNSLDPVKNREVLIKLLVDKNAQNPCASGPEEEELFTPLLGSVENPVVVNGTNKGFRRKGALFVAILLSDAKDASNLTPEQTLSRIKAAIGEDKKVRIFTVGFIPKMKIGTDVPGFADCKPDPAFAESKRTVYGQTRYQWPRNYEIKPGDNPLATLASLTEDHSSVPEGHLLNICGDYGDMLAKFGTQIQQDALKDIEYVLPGLAQISQDPKQKLKVVLGETELTKGVHWDHDVQSEKIIIYAQKIDWEKHANDKIQVRVTPVEATGKDTKW